MKKPSLSLNDRGRIYLDHNATTPPLQSVVDQLVTWAHEWGNPSSIHWSGRAPKTRIRDARSAIAKMLGCHPLEVIFTSGGSESNNYVIKGFYELHNTSERNEYITTEVEHPSVKKSFDDIEARGARVYRLKVDRSGQIDMATYSKLLSSKTALVSIMYANNETGSVFPVAEMCVQAHRVGAKFHTDAVQALGKVPLDISKLEVDYASFAAHKLYSLRGTGVLFCKKGGQLKSLISGGAQERARRAGTENTLSIASFGHVAALLPEIISEKNIQMKTLRDNMEAQILNKISDVQLTGSGVDRLPNTSSLLIEGIDGESLLMNLDIEGVSVSTGAACSSGSPEPSPVLLAMGLSRAEAQKSLRVSLGWSTTQAEIDHFVEILVKVVTRLRSFHNTEKLNV
ncbi:MAG: cysteine desulfurase [Bdellovibrionales bacterium]|nr:cysteine desulfurase [Bdellovibrionales bacterium]